MSGNALRLKGNGQVAFDSADVELGTHDFAIAAWVKGSNGTIAAKAPKTGKWQPKGKTLFIRGGKLVFDTGWVGAVTSRKRIADGKWHHVVANYSHANGQVQLYIDGKLDGSGLLPSDDDDKHVFRIGYTATNFAPPLRGSLDDFRLYNRTLTPQEIATLANTEFVEVLPVFRIRANCDAKLVKTEDGLLVLSLPQQDDLVLSPDHEVPDAVGIDRGGPHPGDGERRGQHRPRQGALGRRHPPHRVVAGQGHAARTPGHGEHVARPAGGRQDGVQGQRGGRGPQGDALGRRADGGAVLGGDGRDLEGAGGVGDDPGDGVALAVELQLGGLQPDPLALHRDADGAAGDGGPILVDQAHRQLDGAHARSSRDVHPHRRAAVDGDQGRAGLRGRFDTGEEEGDEEGGRHGRAPGRVGAAGSLPAGPQAGVRRRRHPAATSSSSHRPGAAGAGVAVAQPAEAAATGEVRRTRPAPRAGSADCQPFRSESTWPRNRAAASKASMPGSLDMMMATAAATDGVAALVP
ncbi:MAG: LamG domain-containing protein [Deltaproteobacteria bacterium]|nr:MAG: LamG domain-containing protein [Deltaproteobacteria bacterium]